MRFAVVLIGLCACGRVAFDPRFDATADVAGDARRSPPVDFGPPMLLSVSETAGEDDPTLSRDELELYFSSDRITLGSSDIFVARRASLTAAFGAVQAVPELNSASYEETPRLSVDGLTMWLGSDRAGSMGIDVYVATRATTSDAWSNPVRVDELASAGFDLGFMPVSDNEALFQSDRDGDGDIFRTTRAGSTWAAPTNVTSLDDGGEEITPFQYGDAIYFVSNRNGGQRDLFVAIGGTITPLTSLNTPAAEEDPWLSADGSRIYFASDRNGTNDIFVAPAR